MPGPQPSQPTDLPVVRPRVIELDSPRSSPVLLEECVEAYLERGAKGILVLLGQTGAGKSTALDVLRRRFEREPRIVLLDEGEKALDVRDLPHPRLVVSAQLETQPDDSTVCGQLRLAPWSADDRIEYLLARHPHRCASVLERCRPETWKRRMGGLPGSWAPILDLLAEREELDSLEAALRAQLDSLLPTRTYRREARLLASRRHFGTRARTHKRMPRTDFFHRWCRIRAHPALTFLLAVEWLTSTAKGGMRLPGLPKLEPFLDELARALDELPKARRRLLPFLTDGSARATEPEVAASLLHRCASFDLGATLEELDSSGHPIDLSGASLPRAAWRGRRVAQFAAIHTDLTGADWREIELDHPQLQRSGFRRADLSGAKIPGGDFDRADLSRARLDGADLTGSTLFAADLTGASLRRARLADVQLKGARVEGADLRELDAEGLRAEGLDWRATRLDGARIGGGDLRRGSFEELVAKNVDFTRGDLSGALFTGSRLEGARFEDAFLCDAGLAHVEWEGANLRGADLEGACFHLGSSRSGLIFSDYALEGSRTGFYTDDFTDIAHRDPKEIRKANLCGADLRGALVLQADFYLVDLRGARMDAEQEAHFRACGAILDAARDRA